MQPIEETKICHSCGGDPQPLSNFAVDMRLADCRVDVCKTCYKNRLREKKAKKEEMKELYGAF